MTTFTDIINRYKLKLEDINFLKDDIKQITKKQKYKVENWNDETISNCGELLARVCALWSLLEIKKSNSYDSKITYKQPHAS